MKNTKFSVFKLAACMLALAGCILLWPNQQTYAAELQKDNYNGWYYENGQAYWYDNGVLARSKEVYDPQTDAWYWFEADGTMARDKDVFIVLNADGTGKWTRYDSDGRMVKGESYKNGAWYYFDLTTGAMAKGFVNLPQSDDPNGKWVYYDPITGRMQYGEQYIDGYWYYFDTATGKMAHGITNIPDNDDAGGKWVYYDSITGRMQYGEQYIDGNRYYFDTATGKMAHGKYYRDGAYYYYDTVTGIMQYGEQTIDGDEYYFDTETGAMVTGEVERDGRYYYYDEETGAMLGLGEQIVKYAEKFLGTPYTWGGTSPDTGFDCSGFTQYVYSNFGIDLDRTSSAQRRQGEAVDEDDIMPGDLVCYSGHVAIYVGNGQVIHSPQEGEVVKISNMHMMSIITIRRFID